MPTAKQALAAAKRHHPTLDDRRAVDALLADLVNDNKGQTPMAKRLTELLDTLPKKRGRPATGSAPNRTIRVSDELWSRWASVATRVGISPTQLIITGTNNEANRLEKNNAS